MFSSAIGTILTLISAFDDNKKLTKVVNCFLLMLVLVAIVPVVFQSREFQIPSTNNWITIDKAKNVFKENLTLPNSLMDQSLESKINWCYNSHNYPKDQTDNISVKVKDQKCFVEVH